MLKNEYGKTLGVVPHQQEKCPTHAMCSSSTLMFALSAYKAGVGHFSCQYRLHPESSHTRPWEQNHTGLAPQSGQTSLQVARNKILPHKKTLLRAVLIKSIVHFGVGWDWLVSNPTPAQFYYPYEGHASTTTTQYGKILGAVPHRQEKHPIHAL